MNQVLISILILTKDRKELLARAIDSVLKQTFTNYEIIVGNEASNDGTEELLFELEKTDIRIKHITNKIPLGIVGNEKMLIREAKGKYAIFLADDDFFVDTRFFELAAKKLEENQDIVMVCAGTQTVDMNGNIESVTLPPYVGKIGGLDFVASYYWTVAGNAFLTKTAILKEIVMNIADDNWESGIEMANMAYLRGNVYFLPDLVASAWTKNPESLGIVAAQKDPLKLLKGIDCNWKLYKNAKGLCSSKGLLFIEKAHFKSMLSHFIDELLVGGYSQPDQIIQLFGGRDPELGAYMARLYDKNSCRFQGAEKIAVFGTNVATDETLKLMKKHHIRCDYVLDDFSGVATYCNVVVNDPKDVDLRKTIIIIPDYKPRTVIGLKKRFGSNQVIERRNLLLNLNILQEICN